MEALNLDQEFWKNKLCLKVKKLKDDSIYIEGYANMATVDRVKEIIGPKAWNLESFNKAGVILFNHDQHKPIGKPVKIEVRNDGLYIKAKISGSNDPEITKIRDLIEEGILNQFSVGFKTRDSKRLNDGTVEITDAELFEVSVVSVPANADSLFKMSTKYLKEETYNEIIKEFLTMKHADAALKFREELKKKNILISSAQDILIREASIPADVVKGLTSGEIQWKPEFYDLVNKLFGINVKKADNEDDLSDDTGAASDVAAETDIAADSSTMGSDEDELEDKTIDKEESEKDKFGDLVSRFKAEAGIEDDQMTPEWLEEFMNWMEARKADSQKSASPITVKKTPITVKELPSSVPIAPAPQTSVAVKPATAVDTEVNPYKQQAEQTNVLLGLVVNLLQTISSQLESSNTQPKQGLELPPVAQQEETIIPPNADMTKSIAVVNRYVENLSQRLKALNL